ncbi:MAG TPA: PEP-CTERM sorting domain-containing protein [Verrucomicrobiae bacterium]|nr:PEP-CTERM sorting domain-containing protein [Verrucomicrobiae bacterium]
MRKSSVLMWILVMFAAVMMVSRTVQAQQSLTWTNLGSGNYLDPANWDDGLGFGDIVYPGSDAPQLDSLAFTNYMNYSVYFSTGVGAEVNSAGFNGGTVTLEAGTNTWVLGSNYGAIDVGQTAGSVATVYQDGGAVIANTTYGGVPTNNFIVGDAGQGSYVLTNGSVLTAATTLGNASTGQGALTISGANSYFTNVASSYGAFTVGNGSAGNQVIVTNGGKLVTGYSYVGYGGGASNNSAVVTGSGSVWNNQAVDMRIAAGFGGSSQSNNSLLVTSGGAVSNVLRVFIADNSAGVNNSLAINDGGRLVFANNSTIASGVYVGSGSGANGNIFYAGGAGAASFITNANAGSANIIVGSGMNSHNNQMIVTNINIFTGGGNVAVGSASFAVGNVATVTSGTLWNMGNGTLRSGAGGSGSPNSNNTFVVTGGGVMTNVQRAFISDNGAGYGNLLIVTNGGQIWFNAGTVSIASGTGGTKNGVIVSGGGFISSGGLAVGSSTATSNNFALVTDTGSVWNMGNTALNIGVGATNYGNTLTVTSGGVVTNAGTVYIADNNPGYNDGVIVSNGGKLFLSSGSAIAVGQHVGDVNPYMTINSGGQVFSSGNSYIGGGGSTNATMLVTGSGSMWNLGNQALHEAYANFTGGTATFGASLTVTAGGVVTNVSAMYITDSGTSSGNGIIINNGGQFFDNGVFNVGQATGASNSYALVGGAGAASTLTAGNGITIGNSASTLNNYIIVTNAAVIEASGNINVGGNATSTNSSVSVLAGGTWTVGNVANITNRLQASGFGGSLVINQGTVANVGETIWGNGGSGNSLIVTNGGQLSNGSAAGTYWEIGRGNSANNNNVTVDGAGSVWDIGGHTLTVGGTFGATTNNVLRLANGGVVQNGAIVVGGGGNNALEMANGIANVNSVTVNGGQILRGSGTLNVNGGAGNVTENGTLSPSLNSQVGILTDNGSMTLGGTYQCNVFGMGSETEDVVNVTGLLTLSGTLSVNAVSLDESAYVIADYGTLSGTFGNVVGVPAGYSVDYNYQGLDDIAIVIPEPSTMALMGVGVTLMIALLRRSRRSA